MRNLIRNRFFLIGLAAFLAAGAVVLSGELFAWSWVVRLLGVVVVLLICVVVLAIGAARANRGAAAIEQSIKMQAQQQVRGARPDRQRDVEELQRQLERAIQMLKQSKLGQGRRGAAALYALPWYLFVGPPGAGKTTAIANSGLNFPVGIDRVRGVGGTRNCDWFFSDKAILLDTAGRYMTEPEDEAEWLSFLDTLKKYRPERPVNGVIVGIGIPEILESTLEEVEWHADTIRNRIEELIRHLGLRFPIYLVFTKTDLLQGFVEFFGELGRREREQVWGCTLRPEQLEADAASVFEEEFDRLYESLLNRRVFRLSHSMKREERQLVYAFPLQFASLREKLALFTHRLFQPNPYQETPVFRGFYFTSGTQEGVPIDRVIQSIAVQFDLPPAAVQASEPELETKSYFIRDLFTDVIVPDQHFARRTSGAARRGRFLQARAAIIALAILGLFVFGVSQALVRSKMTLNRTREAAAAAALVRWTNPADGPSELADLDRLRVEADRLESGSFLTLGLQRAGAVLPSVRSLYLDKSRAFVERYPLQLIQRRLDGLGMARVDSGASQRLYDDLKAYLLLTGESERLRTGESAEDFRSFLARHLGEVSREALQQTDTLAFGADLSDRVNPLTTAYVEAMVRGEVPAFAPNSERVARARRTMDQPLNLAGLYAQLRNRGRDRLQTLTLADLELPPRYEGIFASRAEVPRLYTKEGWESFAEAEIRALSRDPTAEDWVLGRSAQRVPDELRDQGAVARRLEELYYAEYGAAWDGFLRSVQIRQPRSIEEAAEVMQTLGSADSPLLYLFALVADQTRFTSDNPIAEAAGEVAPQVARTPPANPVERRFQWLHRMNPGQAVSGGPEAAPELHQALDAFRSVADALEGLSDDEAALAFAAEVLGQNGGALETAMRSVQRAGRGFTDRTTARNLLEAPIQQSWGTVVSSAQRALSTHWQEEVYRPFQQQLAGMYPFSAGNDDALILDVDQFFNPQTGSLARFVNERLRPFLTSDLQQSASWGGVGMSTEAVRTALAQARRIQEGIFTQGGVLRLAFEMRPELPERSNNAPAVAQIYLDLHGQRDTYNMGNAVWRAYEWPAGTPGATLSVSTRSGQLPALTYSGDWALIRMLDQATVRQTTSSLYEVRWPIEQPGQYTITVVYELKAQRGTNPFEDPLAFFRFTLPPTVR